MKVSPISSVSFSCRRPHLGPNLSKWINLSLVNHTVYSSGAVSLEYAIPPIAFSDFLVFKLAWAVETAEKIQAQRTAYLQSLLKIA
jgi:hypothetical protein